MASRIHRLPLLVLAVIACASACSDEAGAPSQTPGCPEGEERNDAGDCEPVIPCPEGFRPLSGGAGCEAVRPEGDCPPGSAPLLGADACAAVGWNDCPPGFTADPGGWGCREIAPEAACEGASIEVLGEPRCQPIGDCQASFPPPEATFFVSASYTQAELDSTHHATINSALAAAPAGAVIAVDEGVYEESLPVQRAVTIVGRCAEKVIVQNPSDPYPGLDVWGVDGPVEVRGLTLRGHEWAVAVEDAQLTLRDSLLVDSRTAGLLVTGAGSLAVVERSAVRATTGSSDRAYAFGVAAEYGGRLELRDCALAANPFANIFIYGEGSSALVSRSIVRDAFSRATGSTAGSYGVGAMVYQGGAIEIDQSVFSGNRSVGIKVGSTDGAVSSAKVQRSVVRGTLPDDGGKFGRGIEASFGAQVTVSDSLVVDSRAEGLFSGEQAAVRVERSVVRGPAPPAEAPYHVPAALVTDGGMLELIATALIDNPGVALIAQLGGRAVVDGSVVRGTLPTLAPRPFFGDEFGIGVQVAAGGQLEWRASSIVKSHVMGLFLDGADSYAAMSSALVLAVQPLADGRYGRGVAVQGGRADLDRSAVIDSAEVGVIAALGGQAVLRDCSVGPTPLNVFSGVGHGIVAYKGSSLHVEGTSVHQAGSVGIAVSASRAFVGSSFVSANAIGISTIDGSTLVEAAEPSADPAVVVVSPDTRFVDNDTRAGTGSVPLPAPIGAKAP